MRVLAIVCLLSLIDLAQSLTVVPPLLQGPDIPSSPSRSLVARVDDIEVIYHKATCKGQKLLSATTSPHDAAAAFVNPIDSPWTNPIQQELETWGYKIESDDGTPQFRASHGDECEFEHSHKLKSMFDDLRIDTRSTYQGGPNRCYFINHKDGPAVRRDNQGDLPPVKQQWYKANDNYYRVTGAEFTIGVNAASGLIAMTNRQSPATSAQALWGLENPPPNDELPALKSSSDIMWGLWNLASPNNLRGIKYILSTPIINDETVAIIKKILQDNCLDLDEIMIWSGCEFGSDDPEYLALLGSPNGQAVGYFLAQHKAQLGGKYVSKINIFKGDDPHMVAVCLLFTIDDRAGAARAAIGDGSNGTGRIDEAVVVKRVDYKKNVVRRHVVWAKL
ncbi:hypothetical protein J4E89_007148 [Alternaria sp. Ai002NY15]|nr:hypothetical protein J4E89_007148 [Alternaria sp. Ai002NY15]